MSGLTVPAQFEDGGRGLAASADIGACQVALAVPKGLLISRETALNSDLVRIDLEPL